MLSDLYAMGVSECDNMLMLLGVSEQLKPKERQVVTPLVIQGFTGESLRSCIQCRLYSQVVGREMLFKVFVVVYCGLYVIVVISLDRLSLVI